MLTEAVCTDDEFIGGSSKVPHHSQCIVFVPSIRDLSQKDESVALVANPNCVPSDNHRDDSSSCFELQKQSYLDKEKTD